MAGLEREAKETPWATWVSREDLHLHCDQKNQDLWGMDLMSERLGRSASKK